MSSTKTRVVNIYKNSVYDVYIGRAGNGQAGYFGNPYGAKMDRMDAIEAYRKFFDLQIRTDPGFKQKIESLRGKVLGCFCAPLPCHGDVIVEYLEGKQ